MSHHCRRERPVTVAEIDHAVAEAISRHHCGHVAEAESLYRTALGSDPNHAVALFGLGLLSAAQDRPEDAVTAYRRAITVRPDFVDAYINLGSTLLTLGRREEAAELNRQALAISPGNAMALGNLGKALHDLGHMDQAIEAYRASLERRPDNAVTSCQSRRGMARSAKLERGGIGYTECHCAWSRQRAGARKSWNRFTATGAI